MFREFQTHSFILETRAHFYVQFENNDIISVLCSIVSIGPELCTVYQDNVNELVCLLNQGCFIGQRMASLFTIGR